jgi:hypothetical protein
MGAPGCANNVYQLWFALGRRLNVCFFDCLRYGFISVHRSPSRKPLAWNKPPIYGVHFATWITVDDEFRPKDLQTVDGLRQSRVYVFLGTSVDFMSYKIFTPCGSQLSHRELSHEVFC